MLAPKLNPRGCFSIIPILVKDAYILLYQKARQVRDDANLGRVLGITNALTDSTVDDEVSRDLEEENIPDVIDPGAPTLRKGEVSL